ncbi:hypothetical protein KM043_018568 [Ampulex compressa]|nr:hypothetical protein KM043_018568 [Ampulex compressa]
MGLQSPFYSKDLPLSFIYGAFGVQLARHTSEILNRYYGAFYGSINKTAHNNAVNCYRFQIWGEYPEFTYEDLRTEFGVLPNSGQSKESKHIWSNKIKDATGLDIAFKAFKRKMMTRGEDHMRLPGLEKYTNEQLFFIAYANAFCEVPGTVLSSTHAPWQSERTYGNADMVDMSIINNKDFGSIFNCSINTPMNPRKKCTFWVNNPQEI